MARPKNLNAVKRHIGGNIDPALAAAFEYKCVQLGMHRQEMLKRLIVKFVQGEITPSLLGVVEVNLDFKELNAQIPFAHTKPNSGEEGQVLYESPKRPDHH